ncbi:MAG TPA: glycosyltransferase family 9 protein [Solirubrobacteraceae bacterium]|nr:glycosyltransferase family 9 protein [Solirubrobacteraceae bacterium]
MTPGGAPRLVVLRALGLGDFLTGVPALRALATAFPDHERLLLAPAFVRPLAALLGGVVHDVVDTEGRGAPPAALPVQARGADVAVNLHGRGPQSHAALLAAKPRRLIAFACPAAAFADGSEWRAEEHEVARWCRLLTESGIPADTAALDLATPPGTEHHGATVLHPGAAAPARRWPVDRWAAVARAERTAGRQVLLSAGPGEEDAALSVAAAAGLPAAAVRAGGDLEDLARLVAGAGRVACADTGVAHLATALGVPSVVLFGPTPPAEWGPPPERGRHRVLWAGRRGDPNGLAPDPGLLEIEPAAVSAELAAADATPTHEASSVRP